MARFTRAAAHLPAEEVKQRMKTAPRALYRQRWLIIYTAQVAPRTATEIAKECGVSTATVHALISTYNRLGIEAVETVGKGGRHNELLTWHQERELLTPFFARAIEGQIATAGEIQRAYEQRVGHPVHQSTVYRLLERHGWRKLLPRPRHPQADPAEQERFKKTLRERLETAVASRPAEDQRPVLIMAQDEGRFGRVSRPRACWAPPGVRPTAPSQLVREFVQVFAAVAPQTGDLLCLILPTANTVMMNLFLAYVSQSLSDYFIVMQVDQAGWHHSRSLQVPDNIRLIAQPAHSPEVNPVEHLWEELREKYLHNWIFSSLDLLEERLCQGLNAITADIELVRSLMGFPHLKVSV